MCARLGWQCVCVRCGTRLCCHGAVSRVRLGWASSPSPLRSTPPAPPSRLRARRSLRGVEAKQARFGLVECLNHGLLAAYPVTYEKDGDVVAHVRTRFHLIAILLLEARN